jgi:hypothetical protein
MVAICTSRASEELPIAGMAAQYNKTATFKTSNNDMNDLSVRAVVIGEFID